MMKVSIIVPVYNSEKTIERCVESVLKQTYSYYELILVDDGSSDASGRLCDEFAEKNRGVIVIHQKNGGVSSARNTGIQAASGEYILFLDSDDCIKSDMLQTYVDKMKRSQSEVIIGALALLDQNGTVIDQKKSLVTGDFGKEIWNQICKNSEIYGYAGGKMVATKLLKEHNILFDLQLISQEDLAFFLEVYRVADRISILDYCGYCYYYMPGQRSPQYKIYLENQMHIIKCTRQAKIVSEDGEKSIRKRIELLVYAALYSASHDPKEYKKTVAELSDIDGLDEYLKEKINVSETGLIGQAMRLGLYRFIKVYFNVRDYLRHKIKRK